MNRLPLATIIVATAILIALLDFSTSAKLVGSILLMLPLALCAPQRSKSLLWSMAAVTVIVTIAAEFWGFQCTKVNFPRNASVLSLNRGVLGFLVASLFTLAMLVHFWIEKSQKAELIASEIQGPASGLAVRNEQLEIQGSGGLAKLRYEKKRKSIWRRWRADAGLWRRRSEKAKNDIGCSSTESRTTRSL